MAFEAFFNTIFGPLLSLPVVYAVIIISFIVSIIIILITKYTTDQKLMKELKDQIKEHQKTIKEHRSNPSKALELQKKAMDANMKYMMHSLKPTLITFIPIILIFGWMSSTFAYDNIAPNQEFSVTAFFDDDVAGNADIKVYDGISLISNKTQKIEDSKASWSLSGKEGLHTFDVIFDDQTEQKKVLITYDEKFIEPIKKSKGKITGIQINYHPRKILNLLVFGWKLGWLGTYILFSIAFTMILRKFMKVY